MSDPAESNIHLSTSAQDQQLIGEASELVGIARLDESTIYADAKTFETISDWMNTAPTDAETEGMSRVRQAKTSWPCD